MMGPEGDRKGSKIKFETQIGLKLFKVDEFDLEGNFPDPQVYPLKMAETK